MEVPGMLFLTLAIFVFGVACGLPSADEVFIGGESGYYCAEVRPAVELGEKVVCTVYRLQGEGDGR